MEKYIDKKQLFTGLAILAIGIILYKLLIKKSTKDGVETIEFKNPIHSL